MESLDMGWDLLESFPPIALKKMSRDVIAKFYTRTDRVRTKKLLQEKWDEDARLRKVVVAEKAYEKELADSKEKQKHPEDRKTQ